VFLALNQVLFRIGWMFKTETVIVPAFLDAVSGAGWMRGFLPVLNRLGQSIPQLFLVSHLKSVPKKKWAFAVVIVGMSLPFGVLAIVNYFVAGNYSWWLGWLFLFLYFLFFVFGGLNNLSFGTLQGKLIRPTRRGRLLWISSFFGTIPAIIATLWLMPGWLKTDPGHPPAFDRIFAMVAVCMFVSALLVLLVKERPDTIRSEKRETDGTIREIIGVLRANANLRRLILVIILANSGMLLFPHYQAFGHEILGLADGHLAGGHLAIWVVVQSASVGCLSILVGRLADRRGYRITLQLLIIAGTIAPLLAVGIAALPSLWGGRLFFLVYVAMGVAPLGIRATTNYTLEICEPDQHARYLSTVILVGAFPFLFSPLVGLLIDLFGFSPVFFLSSILILCAAALSLGLEEPRHHLKSDELEPVSLDS
jgi:Na+/melibiose symporter-like transporter